MVWLIWKSETTLGKKRWRSPHSYPVAVKDSVGLIGAQRLNLSNSAGRGYGYQKGRLTGEMLQRHLMNRLKEVTHELGKDNIKLPRGEEGPI